LLTVSADKTAKIWDAETFQCIKTFHFLQDIQHMQVGCLWQGNHLITINLRGDITLLDESNPERPLRIINGHSKKINSLAYDKQQHKIYTADMDSTVIEWNVDGGQTAPFEGTPHGNSISKVAISNGHLLTVSVDDAFKSSSLQSREFGTNTVVDGQPIDTFGSGNTVYILTSSKFIAYENGEVLNTAPLTYDATCMAFNSNGNEVAIGDKNKVIHVYTLQGHNLVQKYNLTGSPGYITCMEYSNSGQYLASGDSSRQVRCWEGDKLKTAHWVFHSTMVTSVSWCPDDVHVATGSVDTNIIIWSLLKPMKRIVINGAHFGGVTGVCWVDTNTLASVGADCCLKTWTIVKHPN